MKVTVKWLKKEKACSEEITKFLSEFGESTRLTRKNLLRAKDLDLEWFLHHTRPDLWNDYEAKRQPLLDDYEAKCQLLWDDYLAKCQPLWDDYKAKRANLIADLLGLK